MARLRPFLTELFQRAVGVWRRERSFADSRFNLSERSHSPLLIERHGSGFWDIPWPRWKRQASCPARRTRAASTMYNATRYP